MPECGGLEHTNVADNLFVFKENESGVFLIIPGSNLTEFFNVNKVEPRTGNSYYAEVMRTVKVLD